MIMAVIGAGQAGAEVYRTAEELGAELAERGVTVVCGGLSGVMEAVCKGARGRGGVTFGILPGNAREEANPYVDIAIPSGLGIARNVLVVKSGQAVIALDGEYGTLSEIALALAQGIPVISLGDWQLPGELDTRLIRASGVTDAVDKALAAVAGSGR